MHVINVTRFASPIWDAFLFTLLISVFAAPGAFFLHEAPTINELIKAECERVLPMVGDCLVAAVAEQERLYEEECDRDRHRDLNDLSVAP